MGLSVSLELLRGPKGASNLRVKSILVLGGAEQAWAVQEAGAKVEQVRDAVAWAYRACHRGLVTPSLTVTAHAEAAGGHPCVQSCTAGWGQA